MYMILITFIIFCTRTSAAMLLSLTYMYRFVLPGSFPEWSCASHVVQEKRKREERKNGKKDPSPPCTDWTHLSGLASGSAKHQRNCGGMVWINHIQSNIILSQRALQCLAALCSCSLRPHPPATVVAMTSASPLLAGIVSFSLSARFRLRARPFLATPPTTA
ncbi:hypothetical protein V8C37DRAFT_254050 [Trichoderma ceciliae]